MLLYLPLFVPEFQFPYPRRKIYPKYYMVILDNAKEKYYSKTQFKQISMNIHWVSRISFEFREI